MKYDADFLSKMIDLGKLGYPVAKCANIVAGEDFDRIAFERDFADKKSEVYKNYQIGVDLGGFEIDTKLFALAKSGDLKALAMFEERKRKHRT